MDAKQIDEALKTEEPAEALKQVTQQRVRGDEWMKHFLDATWKIQGPDFEANTFMNLSLGRIRKATSFLGLPPVDSDTAVVVGAGPSLEKDLPLVASLPKEWPLFVCDRALKMVLPYRDDPYGVCILEATLESIPFIQEWFAGIDTSRFRLLTVPYADPSLFEIWKGPYHVMNALMTSKNLLRFARKIEWLTGDKAMVLGSNVGVFATILASNVLTFSALNPRASKPGFKNVVLLGMENVYYEDTRQVNLNVNDINGRDCFVPWNFFIGQFEMRLLAEEGLNRRIRVINCSEAGIVYSPNIVRMGLEDLCNGMSVDEAVKSAVEQDIARQQAEAS